MFILVNYLLVLLIGRAILYKQNDYILDMERAEVVRYDKNYVGFAKVRNSKYNRTHVGINITANFKQNFDYDVKFEVEGYKFASNEYRPFPIQFAQNLCGAFARNDFGLQNIYHHSNFAGCPFKKGNFNVINWSPDYAKFPPYIPGGRYRMDVKIMYFQNEILLLQGFATVTPIKDISPKIWK